ncbi:NAD(P)H-quinone dehydrogenase [Rothia sp. CCM 9417]|uniref:NAD(P)H-quinone dehydrogenase n=1 Tax=unclassified Rothia (in: high G+C Gram-positive bacteria) TaxID=2689056 RepID=UPI003AE3E15E
MTLKTDYASHKLVILGGGPGGYEAALVAASHGADVTLIEDKGMGGSAVLTDVVPSKTLIASADARNRFGKAQELAISVGEDDSPPPISVDLAKVNERLLALAHQQSQDIKRTLERSGVKIIHGRGKLVDKHTIEVTDKTGLVYELAADFILLAVGTHPRELPTAQPDGKRILNWTQLYQLEKLPEELIVVGSGVTGAEFASAYKGLGSSVTLISSRDQVLPGEDQDAATVLENVFERRGVRVMPRSRADAACYNEAGDGVIVTLGDGRKVSGSHVLIAVGSIPNTENLGLAQAGVEVNETGHINVDRVSRTNISNIYAAGDCTGVYPLASVAAMQGRVAVSHMMGDTVKPLRTHQVAANIFTAPEIATVGVSQREIEQGKYQADMVMLPLATNPRAKMMAVEDGFIKIFARKHSGTVIGGVVVGPRASELIFPLSLAVDKKLHVDDIAECFTVYPSLTGSISEAARQLHTK